MDKEKLKSLLKVTAIDIYNIIRRKAYHEVFNVNPKTKIKDLDWHRIYFEMSREVEKYIEDNFSDTPTLK